MIWAPTARVIEQNAGMTNDPNPALGAEGIAAELLRLSPAYAATPLLDLHALAARCGVAQVLAKDEGRRMLRSFKSLGGTYAGLRALARAAGTDIARLLDPASRPGGLPALICASDGNHGLAVAPAARLAGALGPRLSACRGAGGAGPADHRPRVPRSLWVEGTYDDAVDKAADAARAGEGILIADTTDDPTDPVVADVMAGYGVIGAEIRRQVEATGQPRPTHLFVQAGVGGLAAALAGSLAAWLAPPAAVIVVEPASTACVAAALAASQPMRLSGELETSAEMLSCGLASAPALAVLRRHGARAVTVSEAALRDATRLLREHGGPASTPSGVAGFAGLMSLQASGDAASFGLDATSRVLIIITEAELEEDAA